MRSGSAARSSPELGTRASLPLAFLTIARTGVMAELRQQNFSFFYKSTHPGARQW
jgi:hypothetical protein